MKPINMNMNLNGINMSESSMPELDRTEDFDLNINQSHHQEKSQNPISDNVLFDTESRFSENNIPLSPVQAFWNLKSGMLMLLILSVVGSAFTLIYAKHESRKLYTTLQKMQKSKDAHHAEWTQLLLEEGVLSSDVRVEKIARENLNMMVPPSNQVVVIKP